MKDINKMILIGRLGSNPTLRHTKNGIAVTQLSVATSRRIFKNDPTPSPRSPSQESTDGHSGVETPSYGEETQWHRVVVWSRQGEACAKYLKKGDKVYVEGFVRTRSYQDKEGQTRYNIEIHAEDISFLSDRTSSLVPAAGLQEYEESPALSPEFAVPEVSL